MPVFRQSIHRIDCDECGLPFPVTSGGACSRCRRILCARHLYSGFLDKLRQSFHSRAVCVRCRAEEQAAPRA